MYVDVPTKVSAIELINSPDTPKSHILICPFELHRMFDGLISGGNELSVFENAAQDELLKGRNGKVVALMS